MGSIKDQITITTDRGYIKVRPGEHEGPLLINKRLTLEGTNSTIWCREGPVIETVVENIVLKNLQIEVTGDNPTRDKQVAIRVLGNSKPSFINVEVRGLIEGVPGESDDWSYPQSLNLGNLAPAKKYIFAIRLMVPVSCKIVSKAAGVSFNPELLQPGLNEIKMQVGPLIQDSIICSHFFIRSAFIRRVHIYGRVLPVGATETPTAVDRALIWDADYKNKPEDKPKTPQIRPRDIEGKNILQKGERVDLTKLMPDLNEIIIGFGWDINEYTNSSYEIDCSAFLLDQHSKVTKDEDFVFYGNPKGDNGCVLLPDQILLNEGTTRDQKQIAVNLSFIPEHLRKIAFSITIYESNSRKQCFNQLSNLYVRLVNQKKKSEIFLFYIDDLSNETAVVAFELYRYKGHWKVAATGAGFLGGLNALCKHFGVEVEA